jgi:uncharacterized membrane protein YhiD involved in acid resistance
MLYLQLWTTTIRLLAAKISAFIKQSTGVYVSVGITSSVLVGNFYEGGTTVYYFIIIIITYCNWADTRWQQSYTSTDNNKKTQNNHNNKKLQNIKNIKQQNNYKTIKISTQTEHSKCKYYKNTHTHTHTHTSGCFSRARHFHVAHVE